MQQFYFNSAFNYLLTVKLCRPQWRCAHYNYDYEDYVTTNNKLDLGWQNREIYQCYAWYVLIPILSLLFSVLASGSDLVLACSRGWSRHVSSTFPPELTGTVLFITIWTLSPLTDSISAGHSNATTMTLITFDIRMAFYSQYTLLNVAMSSARSVDYRNKLPVFKPNRYRLGVKTVPFEQLVFLSHRILFIQVR